MNGTLYADGGIMNNFPVEPIMAYCDKIIGVYVNPVKKIEKEDLHSALSVLERAYDLSRSNISIHKFGLCDYVISPESLNRYGTFAVNQMDEIFNIGYSETIKFLEENYKLLS